MNFSFQWVPMAAKGTRYFVRYGSHTKFNRGFRTKAAASSWINELEHVDWRVGFRFRMKGDSMDAVVVTRMGHEILP